MTVAATIAQQLGFTLKMIGARTLIDHGDALSFRIYGRGPQRVNHIKVTLDASDTYTMTFSQVPGVRALCNGKDPKVIAEVSGIYAASMKAVIESNTGLYTSL